MQLVERPTAAPSRLLAIELDETHALAEQLCALDLALLLVVAGDLDPSIERALVERGPSDLVGLRVRPDAIDAPAFWLELDARIKLRRTRLPDDRMLVGAYLFEEGRLRGWHPLTRFVGAWVEQCLAPTAGRA